MFCLSQPLYSTWILTHIMTVWKSNSLLVQLTLIITKKQKRSWFEDKINSMAYDYLQQADKNNLKKKKRHPKCGPRGNTVLTFSLPIFYLSLGTLPHLDNLLVNDCNSLCTPNICLFTFIKERWRRKARMSSCSKKQLRKVLCQDQIFILW